MRCTGLVSKVSKHPFFSRRTLPHVFVTRCQGLKGDLDSDLSKFLRSRVLTEGLIQKLPDKTLWESYGIIAPVVIRSMYSLSPWRTSNHHNLQPFTNYFECADIYKLIAPDLLHQAIIGTFKDHLVSWVGAYLKKEHGDRGSRKILDDIDRR